MSLVSEALRKARREAAERKRPSRLPAALPEPPGGGRGTRFGAGLVLGASIALAAALLGAATTWWVVSRAVTEPAGHELAPTPTPAPAGEAAVPAAVPATTPTPVAGLPAVPTPTPDRAVETVGRLAQVASPTTHEPVGEPRPTESPAPPREDLTRASDPEPSTSAGERAFVLEADLGYARLSLGFVVARQTDPFAEVNGREVHVGDVVDGFTVEEISARGVRLRDARGSLELRLR